MIGQYIVSHLYNIALVRAILRTALSIVLVWHASMLMKKFSTIDSCTIVDECIPAIPCALQRSR
jgi:hypothetical protein